MKLKMLAAWIRNSRARDSFTVIVLLSDISITNCPGPSMMLRPASPNNVPLGLTQVFVVPAEVDGCAKGGGVEPLEAEGFESEIGAPVTSARSEPLTPRSMSSELPRTRGVYQRPLATVKSPLSGPRTENVGQRAALQIAMIFAERQFSDPVAGELVLLIKARKTAVGRDVEWILCDNFAATADRRSVVDRFRKCVNHAVADAVRLALAEANRARVKNGIARGGFVDERLKAGDFIDSALGVEPRALRAVVIDVEQESVRQRALDVEIPDLHVAEAIVRIDRKIIGDEPRRNRGETVGEGERRTLRLRRWSRSRQMAAETQNSE